MPSAGIEPDNGASRIALPAAAAAGGQFARKLHRARTMAPRRKVLIVEDDSDLRRLYAIGLNKYGFEVKLAANGAEALDRAETEHPDLLLLDLVMPVMDGWEVLEKINSSGRTEPIPVVIISGQLEHSGGRDHPSIRAWLNKPVTIASLAKTIERHIR